MGKKTSGKKSSGATTTGGKDVADIFTEMLRLQGEAARQVVQTFAPQAAESLPDEEDIDALGSAIMQFQENWFRLNTKKDKEGHCFIAPFMADPAQWMAVMQAWYEQFPALDPERQQELWEEGVELWGRILEHFTPDGEDVDEAHKGEGDPHFPRSDRRFADPAWREQPVFALIHQTYLLLAEKVAEAVDEVEGIDEDEREQLRFATKSVLDAMSPSNFPLMNPVVLERTIEQKGENLVKGMERLAADLEKGQLTHTDTSQFVLGENVAATPGKVIYETELYQLIQYSPATEEVLEVPLLLFPPWINRFYILDLNPKKSFVKWAVDQGLTVVLVSWRSADESLAHIGWDDYVRAQIEAIDVVRERLKVGRVHALGYCVAGTTLAATLAILARRGESLKVASATFLTAQVDFEEAGQLKLFTDDAMMELVKRASRGGYMDGRYMAATFNLLRGSDLIWNYVVNHYMLGEDYPAFDLLFWNGDVTNLPAKWHAAYLENCYRDNLLVKPDALEADGTPIDLGLIATPAYVQAGREDHIAPPESVFRLTKTLSGIVRFVLAGSGHIAGVINPPDAHKYQYWTGDRSAASLDQFVSGAEEHPGSWWPDWLVWISEIDPRKVKARGRRKPGSKSNPAIEDAPGRYVRMH
ncbi:PHA/PHB synthase family protein [Alteraurantiacibacter aquimixticola]|uniref:Class I poly(R)-hydroxyalkanoic acid synthase n=1 Tax=Alteraurantiacibacter aquimixticola TaxID=2489173 RepID=A0A4T3F835_9SPHN|nr:class I poly(R)-hydroxyalkanoic acid synthase [Alteraurantiacibacter aquimixticola]TIX51170.1 class I poly(R)-hydroxyalkanoic acid synthase [Alteraurantiacibacter aquimixticola]